MYEKAPPTTAGLTHRDKKIYEKGCTVEPSVSSDLSWINTQGQKDLSEGSSNHSWINTQGRKIYQKAPPTTAGLTHRGRKIYEKNWPVERSISSDHSWINTKHYAVELSVFPDCSWDRDTGTETSMKHTALWSFQSSLTAAGTGTQGRKHLWNTLHCGAFGLPWLQLDWHAGTETSMKHTALWSFRSSLTAAGLTRRDRRTYEKQRPVELSVFPECS